MFDPATVSWRPGWVKGRENNSHLPVHGYPLQDRARALGTGTKSAACATVKGAMLHVQCCGDHFNSTVLARMKYSSRSLDLQKKCMTPSAQEWSPRSVLICLNTKETLRQS